jgi:osmotically-inducible protein OsmY
MRDDASVCVRGANLPVLKEIVMRVSAALVILAIVGLTGCRPIASDVSPPVTSATPSAPSASDASSIPAPDNTAINQRDADGATKTPIDQDETSPDVKTTAEIRKRVVAQEGLSLNAQNAKIITADGKVTLRGPVESAAERDTLDRIAREVAGDANVDNQLEVANP